MKKPDDIQTAQKRFAELAQNFDPKEESKEHPLESFIDHIRMLRANGATYKTVNGMLKQVGVEVCDATLARFCQVRLLNPPRRKVSRKRSKKNTTKAPLQTPENKAVSTEQRQPEVRGMTPKKAAENTKKELPKRRRGPRIADPKNI